MRVIRVLPSWARSDPGPWPRLRGAGWWSRRRPARGRPGPPSWPPGGRPDHRRAPGVRRARHHSRPAPPPALTGGLPRSYRRPGDRLEEAVLEPAGIQPPGRRERHWRTDAARAVTALGGHRGTSRGTSWALPGPWGDRRTQAATWRPSLGNSTRSRTPARRRRVSGCRWSRRSSTRWQHPPPPQRETERSPRPHRLPQGGPAHRRPLLGLYSGINLLDGSVLVHPGRGGALSPCPGGRPGGGPRRRAAVRAGRGPRHDARLHHRRRIDPHRPAIVSGRAPGQRGPLLAAPPGRRRPAPRAALPPRRRGTVGLTVGLMRGSQPGRGLGLEMNGGGAPPPPREGACRV